MNVQEITQSLIALSEKATEYNADLTRVDAESAELWRQVIDNKLHREAGVKSLAEYMSLVGTQYTRGYIYNLADCARCAGVISHFEDIGSQSSIIIAKAYKQDKIDHDQVEKLVESAIDNGLTVQAVKAQVKEAVESNKPQQDETQALLEEQESLIKERARLKDRLAEINARLEELEDTIAERISL